MTDWENYAAEQKKIDSRKKRQIVLKLSDREVEWLFDKAAGVNMFPEELLENFIADFIGSTYSNGSDERGLAARWFERCGFSMMMEYDFCTYLRDNELWDEAVECLAGIEEDRALVEQYSKEIKTGFHLNRYKGEVEPWNKYCSNRDDWEQSLRRSIRSYGKEMSKLQNGFEEEFWKPFLDYMKSRGKKVTATMESEIQKIWEWRERYQQLLEEYAEEEEEERQEDYEKEGNIPDKEQSVLKHSRKGR